MTLNFKSVTSPPNGAGAIWPGNFALFDYTMKGQWLVNLRCSWLSDSQVIGLGYWPELVPFWKKLRIQCFRRIENMKLFFYILERKPLTTCSFHNNNNKNTFLFCFLLYSFLLTSFPPITSNPCLPYTTVWNHLECLIMEDGVEIKNMSSK